MRSSNELAFQEIKTTNERPFYVDGSGWISAAKLAIGQRVIQADGKPSTIVANKYESHPRGTPVFNFEVEDFHTYFVSQDANCSQSILVHNTCPAWITKGSLPAQEEQAVLATAHHINAKTKPPWANEKWGSPHRNDKGHLPGNAGAGGYKENDVRLPGQTERGLLRIVVSDSDGSGYYTWTHYGKTGIPAFVRIW